MIIDIRYSMVFYFPSHRVGKQPVAYKYTYKKETGHALFVS